MKKNKKKRTMHIDLKLKPRQALDSHKEEEDEKGPVAPVTHPFCIPLNDVGRKEITIMSQCFISHFTSFHSHRTKKTKKHND